MHLTTAAQLKQFSPRHPTTGTKKNQKALRMCGRTMKKVRRCLDNCHLTELCKLGRTMSPVVLRSIFLGYRASSPFFSTLRNVPYTGARLFIEQVSAGPCSKSQLPFPFAPVVWGHPPAPSSPGPASPSFTPRLLSHSLSFQPCLQPNTPRTPLPPPT